MTHGYSGEEFRAAAIGSIPSFIIAGPVAGVQNRANDLMCMPIFLWTGKDRYCNPLTQRIEAANAEQAKGLLLERGYRDLELILDEVTDALTKDCSVPVVSPEEQLRFYRMGRARLSQELVASFKKHYGVILLMIAFLVVDIVMKWHWFIFPAIAGILVFPAIDLWYAQSLICYSRLNRAKVWRHWSEVLHCVKHLRRAARWTKIGVPEYELVRCRAQALAGSGQLNEALNEFGGFQDSPELPDWMFFSLLSSIYEAAGARREVVECSHKSLAAAPEIPSVVLGHAFTLVRHTTDTLEARRYLEKVEQMVIPDLGQPFLPLCRGLIARSEEKFEEAREHLVKALQEFECRSHMELVEGLVLLTKGYLCSVYARLGRKAEARRLFAECEKFLRAAQESELLSDCKAGLL